MFSAERYRRNQPIIPPERQADLAALPVAVIGLGGLGGAIAEQLVRLGFLNLTLVDYDVFSLSNLNRQRFSTEASIGKPKTDVVAEALRAIHSGVQLTTVKAKLTVENAGVLSAAALLFDALDSGASRCVLSDISAAYDVPVVHGAISGWLGQAGFFEADTGILRRIYENQPPVEEKNNLPMVANIVASVQVAEAVKHVTGQDVTLKNRLLMMDFSTYDMETIHFNSKPNS